MMQSTWMSGARRRTESRPQLRAAAGLAVAALALTACGGGGSSSSQVAGAGGTSPRLVRMEFGRLADVYGLGAAGTVELFRRDVMIGSDIDDERGSGVNIPDSQITYDFLSADPDTLQPRLLITRTVGTTEFETALDRVDDKLREVTAAQFGGKTAFSVVPRNAAIRLTFSHDLGIDDGFFVTRDANGVITGQLNTEAVQLLEIVGDPNDANQSGDFRVITSRFVPQGNRLIIDPVLLGSEGLQYGVRNNASGMPESPDQSGANIRIALALEGPLAIPGLRPDRVGSLEGFNNSGQSSVIRDFRSGNSNDSTPEISQGFVRDSLAPRLIGQMVMYLENVQAIDGATTELTFYKNQLSHEIDRGDVVRLIVDNSGVPAAVSEVVVDPSDDAGLPSVSHVRAAVRREFSPQQVDLFQAWDPSDPTRSNLFWQSNPGIPAYPSNPTEREAWLVEYAPRLVLVAEFTAERTDANGTLYGDDARNFVTFSPAPLPFANGTPSKPNENVSPFASAIVRFTKPVDMSTVQALDSFFFATRDLFDPASRQKFITDRNIDPVLFLEAKYYTPHLVGSKVFDEDGSQTNIRLQPTMGFYLDDSVRQDEGLPFAAKSFKYYLHLLSGVDGIKDLAGNSINFQSQSSVRDNVVIPFSLDTREDQDGNPLFADNLSVTVARRFENADEDEQPSYYQVAEVPAPNASEFNELAFNLQDVFGPVVYLTDGSLAARPTARVRQIVDDLNQQSPPPQSSNARYCPLSIGGEGQVTSPSAGAKFGSPLQNPLNPFGCRLQTVWREVDMSLSRTDPIDFNLDVEQMYWAPFTSVPVAFDEFDRVSLFLGHSEVRPVPCVGSFSALPSLPQSGLSNEFADNYVYSVDASGSQRNQPAPHPAYVDQAMTILPGEAVSEPNGVNRFLPLPTFQKPYFVWRDETLAQQGGNSRVGNDTSLTGNNFVPYILSPFLGGRGRYATKVNGAASFTSGAWDNRGNSMVARTLPDDITGGLVGTIGLPLLGDFWTYPDSPNLPEGDPFQAAGINGWQIALAVQSSPLPAFRAYSAGGVARGSVATVDPTTGDWVTASGGYNPNGGRTTSRDNSVFWVMADFLKRQSVVTAGYVEILNPHRMPSLSPDPRLGPYLGGTLPAGTLPNYAFAFEPPLSTLPGGTAVNVEFSGAGPVDTLNGGPWAAVTNQFLEPPDTVNFPLDPLKAGDAHIRKFDDRQLNGTSRNAWTYYYNRNVTDYTAELTDLSDSGFTNQFSGPNEFFLAEDVTYFNWRFIFENNVDANPPVSPVIDSFTVTYRLEKTN